MIDRSDMLELTRRMTLKRTHFTRAAGCYVDRSGDFDGSFNRAFSDLPGADREKLLALAKHIPFAGTNEELSEQPFRQDSTDTREMWRLLYGIRSCGLKNDALLDTFYDIVMEKYHPGMPYSILLFHGAYDIPRKASDGTRLGESENVYEYIICAVCPLLEDYESGTPFWGFLFPAYGGGCADLDHIDVYHSGELTIL